LGAAAVKYYAAGRARQHIEELRAAAAPQVGCMLLDGAEGASEDLEALETVLRGLQEPVHQFDVFGSLLSPCVPIWITDPMGARAFRRTVPYDA
jgi:hypothetical protein